MRLNRNYRPFGGKSLFTVLLLAGCSVGPAYRAPELVPATLQSAGTTQESAQVDAISGWAEGILPDLSQTLKFVAQNNNDIRVAAANMNEAWAKLRAARGGLLPVVNVNGAGNSTDAAGVSGENYQGGVQAAWEIDLWGRIRKGIDATRADAIAIREVQRGTQLSLLSEFVDGYLVWLGLQESLAVSQHVLDVREEALKLQKARFDAGGISLLDLKQSQAARDSVAAKIPEFKARIYDSERALLTLLGATDRAVLPSKAKVSEVVFKLPDIRGSLGMLRARPDVAAAEARVFSAEFRASESFRTLLPRLSFQGLVNYESDDFSRWIRQATRFWSLGGEAAWTAFSGGTLWQNYRAAEARQKAAMARYAGTVISAANEIQAARERLAAGRAESELRSDELRSQGDVLQTAKLLYSEGRVAYLNVLDAQRDSLNSELSLINSQVELGRRYVGFQRALGVFPIYVGANEISDSAVVD